MRLCAFKEGNHKQNTLICACTHYVYVPSRNGIISKMPSILMFSPLKAEAPCSKTCFKSLYTLYIIHGQLVARGSHACSPPPSLNARWSISKYYILLISAVPIPSMQVYMTCLQAIVLNYIISLCPIVNNSSSISSIVKYNISISIIKSI